MPGRYAFDGREPNGDELRWVRLEGRPEWFDPGPPRPGTPVTAPPPSVVASLWFQDGLLWVGTWVADADWRADPTGRGSVNPRHVGTLFDTVMEVIDPSTGEVIAHARHDEALRRSGDGALLFGVRQTGGVSRALIYEARLVGADCEAVPR